MTTRWNNPPGWPDPPPGWMPPPGWAPPADWPKPPPDWEYYVDEVPPDPFFKGRPREEFDPWAAPDGQSVANGRRPSGWDLGSRGSDGPRRVSAYAADRLKLLLVAFGVLGIFTVFFAVRGTGSETPPPLSVATPPSPAPTTEPAQTPSPGAASWTGLNSAGQPYTIYETDSTGFTNGAPTAIDIIDSLQDCDSLAVEFDGWLYQYESPVGSGYEERADVYATYAQAKGIEMGCPWAG